MHKDPTTSLGRPATTPAPEGMRHVYAGEILVDGDRIPALELHAHLTGRVLTTDIRRASRSRHLSALVQITAASFDDAERRLGRIVTSLPVTGDYGFVRFTGRMIDATDDVDAA